MKVETNEIKIRKIKKPNTNIFAMYLVTSGEKKKDYDFFIIFVIILIRRE